MIENIFSIKKKRVLITGSSRGLGFTLAEGLAKAGAEVILNARNEETLERSRAKLQDGGGNVKTSVFDITEPDQVDAGISKIEEEIGEIELLVNNAGIQLRKPLVDFPFEDWNRVLNTNLTGAFIVTQRIVGGMIKKGRGKIVNICSLQSELGRKTIAPYTAAKGGLKMLTKAMTVEWAGYNIQINGLGPGYFKTEMTKALVDNEQFNSWICNRTPAGRWGAPEELVGPLIFLLSDASSFVTGQLLYVDGGILASM